MLTRAVQGIYQLIVLGLFWRNQEKQVDLPYSEGLILVTSWLTEVATVTVVARIKPRIRYTTRKSIIAVVVAIDRML